MAGYTLEWYSSVYSSPSIAHYGKAHLSFYLVSSIFYLVVMVTVNKLFISDPICWPIDATVPGRRIRNL